MDGWMDRRMSLRLPGPTLKTAFEGRGKFIYQ